MLTAVNKPLAVPMLHSTQSRFTARLSPMMSRPTRIEPVPMVRNAIGAAP